MAAQQQPRAGARSGAAGTESTGTPSAPSTGTKVPGTPREIADATGVTEQRERAEQARRDGAQVKTYTAPNGDKIVEGETVEQMRARVRQERLAEEPTAFMQSLTHVADPNAVGGGNAGVPTAGGGGATGVGTGGATTGTGSGGTGGTT